MFDMKFVRLSNQFVLILLVLCLAQPVNALLAKPMSPSTVLVLRLVSATHVKPTTGIVLSADGLVLVPADFISEEGEIIVLDGGTDILTNGRPAKVVKRSVTGDLAVLSVDGLNRPGITLSAGIKDIENVLYLEAYPPAEFMAKGAPPLWEPVKVLNSDSNKGVLVSSETPLPYVTGPIFDACGYLAGLSMTTGPQNIGRGKQPVTIFTDEIKRILDSMQITLPRASCEFVDIPTDTKTTAEGTVAVSQPQKQSPESSANKPWSARIKKVPVRQSSVNRSHNPAFDPFDPIEARPVKPPEPPSLWRSIPFWLLLIGLIALVALIWKAFIFLRSGKSDTKQIPTGNNKPWVQPASDEPDTAPLQPDSDTNSVKPRAAPVDEMELPDMNALPDGCDGVLVVDGAIDTDTRFKQYCAVNTKQINVIIGRGDTDINIKHPVISRSHARLESDGEFMTLSDLGSSSGTFIKGIPCLQGEVLFIETEDEIFLGDVQLRFSVIRKEVELS